METASQVTTVTFFHFHRKDRWWMFRQMGLAGRRVQVTEGLKFFRLMGSGGENGFSIKPDLSTYILLCVWDSETASQVFFHENKTFNELRSKAERYWTVYLHNIKAHGKWSGVQPFQTAPAANNALYVVITRATIKPHRLVQFWSYVPAVSKDLESQEGLLFSKGIGEFPVFMQATISIWQCKDDMVRYAYRSKLHSQVIAKTRRLGWYREELFANFRPFRVEANFDHPLAGYFK